MSELKAKHFVALAEEKYFTSAATAEHNGVTVCVLRGAIPVKPMTSNVTRSLLKAVTKGFPEVEFNFNQEHEAFLVTTKGKAVCTKEDTFDETQGKRISYAKAKGKILKVASKIATLTANMHKEYMEHCTEVAEYLANEAEREFAYVTKV